MYLKNKSNTVVVVINTVVGKIGIQPGEIIDLQCNLLPPVSENIIKVTQEEYLLFCKSKQPMVEKTIQEINEIPLQQNISTHSSNEESIENPVEAQPINDVEEDVPVEIIDEVTQNIQDPNTSDFIKNLLNFDKPVINEEISEEEEIINFEEKGNLPEENALLVKDMDSQKAVKKLKEELQELKNIWVKTRNIRKKDKLSKQIKELQKQLDKLEKEI